MKEKDYDKMADAIVKKNYEYRNKIGSIVCIVLGVILIIGGIVDEAIWKRDFNEYSFYGWLLLGLGVVSLIAGVAWLIYHYTKKKRK